MKSLLIKNKVQSRILSLRYPFKLLPSPASSYQLIGVFTILPWCLSASLCCSYPDLRVLNRYLQTDKFRLLVLRQLLRMISMGIRAQNSCISLLPRSISVGPRLLEPGDGSSLQGRSSCERVEIAPMSGGSNMESFWQGRSGPICLWGKHPLPPVLFHQRPQRAIIH